VTLTGQDIFGRAVSLSRTTDVNGQYAFEKLVEANADGYTVSASFSGNAKNENGKDYLLIGTSRIASNTANSAIKVALSGTNKSAIVDFTEKLKPVKYSIAGKVFLDTLQDGELETAELDKALANITVTLSGKDKFGRTVSLTRNTDVNGQYVFADLTEANIDGYSVSASPSGLNNYKDGKDYLIVGNTKTVSNTPNNTVVVALSSNTRNVSVDFTELLGTIPYTISGRVFLDTLQDGELETAELDKALANITVTLSGKDKFGRTVSLTRNTDVNGQYVFANLTESNADGYSVSASPSGLKNHKGGKDYLIKGNAKKASNTPNNTVVAVLSGSTRNVSVDFTEQLDTIPYTISGHVFLDTLQDGELETAELDKALANITVTLTGKDKFGRAVSLTRTTDVNGQYAFADLTEANKDGYSVAATLSDNTAHENGKDYLKIGANRTESDTANSTVNVPLSGTNKSATV
ncbi:hypothetical protein AAEU28_17755, partial [Pseudoalteromonas sp. SS15]|uniref:hypothetical protein n=1 Tax=Pseudoalteromonas sp. SS15 TaxID=3139393 RepID=UPI003BAD9216